MTTREQIIEVGAITPDDIEKLVHMLGAGDHVRLKGYRNYYAASVDNVPAMQRLEAHGLVEFRGEHYELHYYRATAAGCDAAGLSKAAKRRAIGDARADQ